MEAMKQIYVADTVALVNYFFETLPKKAGAVFEKAEKGEAVIFVPAIALGELAYLAAKGKVTLPDPIGNIREAIRYVCSAEHLRVVDFPTDAWDAFFELQIPELHDRMISAVALSKKVPVITNDQEIAKSRQVETIW